MKQKSWIFMAVLAAILVVIYARTLNSEFVWDDALYFKHNLLLGENKPLTAAFTTGYFSEQMGFKGIDHYYRPLLTASFMMESKLWGIHPAALRIVNLLLFIGSLWVLYSFFRRLSPGTFMPEIAVLLFALHPISADNLLWVVGRSDLLLLLFGALAFLFLEMSTDQGKGVLWLAGSGCFLLGMFSKESFLLLWPALLVFDWARHKKIHLPFHVANAMAIGVFFIVKSGILGIKNPRILSLFSAGGTVQVALGTLGYYVKSLLWPFAPRLFLSLAEAKSMGYIILGATAIILFLCLAYLAVRDRGFAAPAFLAGVFLIGHVGMAFSSAFPYTIYSRYVMVAWLGIAWILALLIGRLDEKVRLYPVFVLLLTLIPTTYLGAGVYKTELTFWQTMASRTPNDGYVQYQLANANLVKGNNIQAELVLNHTLSLSLRREVAMLVSQLYEKVDAAKADYRGAGKWLDSIEEVASEPNIAMAEPVRFQIKSERAKLAMSQGDAFAAEGYLKENIKTYPQAEVSYTDLFAVYVGSEMWDKAREIERELRRNFPSRAVSVDKLETQFKSDDREARILVYAQYRNFGRAAALLLESGPLDLAHALFLARMDYFKGDAAAGEAVVAGAVQQSPGRYETLNSIAAFYLKDLNRVPEAVAFLQRSLALNPDQPQIRALADNLTTGFLEKIKPVWK